MFIKFGVLRSMMKKWERRAIIMDRVALPFWIVLMIYAIYEIVNGNQRAWIILIIIAGAFVIDTTFVVKNRKVK